MNYENTICPIYFEDHQFGGHVSSIENFTNLNFGTVRTTFLNRKPYFCGVDICRGLCLNPKNSHQFIMEAVRDILDTYTPSQNKCQNIGGSNTPPFQMGGCLDVNNPGIIPNIDPEELYFVINLDVSHRIGNSEEIITQKVNTVFISEPVLYMLSFRSRKKEAVSFKAWLAVEILPNLRALGGQNTNNMISNGYQNITDALEKINDIYDNTKDCNSANIVTKSILHDIITGQRSENQAIAQLQDSIINLYNILYGIGYTDGYILDNTAVLNEKVTDIASGLNMVFGRSRR